MEIKTYEIPELIAFGIINDGNVIKNIKQYYPNLIESDKNAEFYLDYRVCNNFNSFPSRQSNQSLKPFRNCVYYSYMDKNTGYVFAYAPKTNQTIEHALIRNGNYIQVLSNEINGKVFLRTIRELILRKYISKGYFPLHASSTVFNKKTSLQFGPKNSGKSTALFKKIIIDKHSLMSNDITLVGQETNGWNAISASYDLTFDPSLFNINSENKIRFKPEEFCEKFNIEWCSQGLVDNISFITLDKNQKFHQAFISQTEFLDKLIKYGKDSHFNFDDYLFLNNLNPEFNYENLSHSFIAAHISGNIFDRKR